MGTFHIPSIDSVATTNPNNGAYLSWGRNTFIIQSFGSTFVPLDCQILIADASARYKFLPLVPIPGTSEGTTVPDANPAPTSSQLYVTVYLSLAVHINASAKRKDDEDPVDGALAIPITVLVTVTNNPGGNKGIKQVSNPMTLVTP